MGMSGKKVRPRSLPGLSKCELREKSGYEGFKMHDFGETELNSRNTAKPVKQEIS